MKQLCMNLAVYQGTGQLPMASLPRSGFERRRAARPLFSGSFAACSGVAAANSKPIRKKIAEP